MRAAKATRFATQSGALKAPKRDWKVFFRTIKSSQRSSCGPFGAKKLGLLKDKLGGFVL
jgi:hypothetical protein